MQHMDFTFYNRADYVRQVRDEILQTGKGDRVLVATMTIDAGEPGVHALLEALIRAAQQGASVTLLVDAYNFLSSPNKLPGPLWYHSSLPDRLAEPFRRDYRGLEAVAAAGANVVLTNQPHRRFSFIPGGRSHIKCAVVNDKLYIGGCNLNSVKTIDVMTAWQDTQAADWMYDKLSRMADTGSSQAAFGGEDQVLPIGADSQLLIDAGTPGQSTILREAYHLIDNAEESLFMTCQYFPGGSTARHLAAAYKRGVRIHLAYSHPSVHGIEAPGHFIYAVRERTRVPQALFTHRLKKGLPKLHAKVLCSEKAAMIGSHNYVSQGVRFGTAEVALQVRTPAYAAALQQFMQTML